MFVVRWGSRHILKEAIPSGTSYPKDRDNITQKSSIIYRFKGEQVDSDEKNRWESARTFGERFKEFLRIPYPIYDFRNTSGHTISVDHFSIGGREAQSRRLCTSGSMIHALTSNWQVWHLSTAPTFGMRSCTTPCPPSQVISTQLPPQWPPAPPSHREGPHSLHYTNNSGKYGPSPGDANSPFGTMCLPLYFYYCHLW